MCVFLCCTVLCTQHIVVYLRNRSCEIEIAGCFFEPLGFQEEDNWIASIPG